MVGYRCVRTWEDTVVWRRGRMQICENTDVKGHGRLQIYTTTREDNDVSGYGRR